MENKLKTICRSIQDSLNSNLIQSRTVFSHSGTKGDATEFDWKKFFEDHLPKRYQVSKAFIMDSRGNQSDQIDIVIYDWQYTPMLINQHNEKIVPAESVYAIFEVKQNLNLEHIKYTSDKIESVRKLLRTNAKVIHAGGVIEKPRPLFPIIGGILTTTCDWTPCFGDPLVEAFQGLNERNILDLGCVSTKGYFEITKKETDYLLNKTEDDLSLIKFLFTLLRLLQERGTVPALDYGEYLQELS